MVVTKVKQIKSYNNLKRAVKYILDDEKTLYKTVTDDDDVIFPLVFVDGEPVSQLISSHLIVNPKTAYEEMRQLKVTANLQKGRPINYEELASNDVLAHHIIQSFAPDDDLTPQEVHAIGRKTAMELTGSKHGFVIATHMDKGHLHNHIIFNSTNSVTLNKFRWQKQTANSLFNISNKHAELAGAKVLEQKSFGHKEYLAYRRKNVFKLEIKSRLDFLIKHSTNLEDFKAKAESLSLSVDFSGKHAKYCLLDSPQERATRDRTLSKQGRYSLEQIAERVSKNEVVLPLEEIKSEYDKLQKEKADDFEIQVKIEPWQVDSETKSGIYLLMQYGVANQGTVKIPSHMIDKQDDDSFILFIKKSDFFYFINPDNSESNKFMKGSTLINQLAYESGEYIMKKNPNISKLSLLVKEYNYLVSHGISDSDQFHDLHDRFIDQIKETQATLKELDAKIEKLNKITSALEDIKSDTPVSRQVALDILESLHVSPQANSDDIKKEMIEVSFERKLLNEKFDQVVKDFTQYKRVKDNAQARRLETNKQKEEEHSL
ncbi:helical hairpin domain-containing protein [Streptococcus sp. zg-JUN1979]|uniref:helical hairpin domain-containing protein n=1 Tax=Streptococcus sp. zg-JUN1979 TaxID=3391450 RepID=UPI0039A67DD1